MELIVIGANGTLPEMKNIKADDHRKSIWWERTTIRS